MWTRVGRDVGILIGFCLAFYLLTVLVNWVGGATDEPEPDEYSHDRRMADYFVAKRDWQNATIHFQHLTEEDPFNGHAWFNLGYSYRVQMFSIMRRIQREERRSEPDQQEIERCREEIRPIAEKAIPALEKALDFPRYRNLARFHLARTYAFLGNSEMAIKYLNDAFEDGFVYSDRYGLTGVYEFQSIRDLPEFEAFVQRNRNARRQGYRRYQRSAGFGMEEQDDDSFEPADDSEKN